jgi:hypothetical protein
MMPQSDINSLGPYNLEVKTLFLYVAILSSITLSAKVDPPNYNFSVDKFLPFMPGSPIVDLITKHKPKVEFQDKEYTTYKFYIKHIRYKFAMLVQVKDGKITDFHARLPHYFLHDVFHQSLINRYGVQDKYTKTEESALYLWNEKNNISHLYSGGCTITCFPIFYAAYLAKHDFGKKYKRVLDKLMLFEF